MAYTRAAFSFISLLQIATDFEIDLGVTDLHTRRRYD
jgi:hypothetical protein